MSYPTVKWRKQDSSKDLIIFIYSLSWSYNRNCNVRWFKKSY